MKQLKWSGLLAMIFALSACGSSNHSSNSSTSAIDNGSDTVGAASRSPEVFPSGFDINHSESVAGPTLLSCSAEIGGSAATEKVAVCRNVSPATHPPCNVANSCAMIDDEIARSCALFDGKGSPMAGCTPSPKSPQAAIAVIERYYSAINAHDYGTAWAQWGESGPSGQSREKFEKGYALTRKTKVTIGRSRRRRCRRRLPFSACTSDRRCRDD